jgi:hypothetical protein
MILLRAEQVRAVEEPQRRAYEDIVLAHVQRCFPRVLAELGDSQARARVRCGIERADRYGIRGRQSACRFVNLVFALGPGFDERFPWAKAMLEGPGTPSHRLDRVVERVMARGTAR